MKYPVKPPNVFRDTKWKHRSQGPKSYPPNSFRIKWREKDTTEKAVARPLRTAIAELIAKARQAGE